MDWRLIWQGHPCYTPGKVGFARVLTRDMWRAWRMQLARAAVEGVGVCVVCFFLIAPCSPEPGRSAGVPIHWPCAQDLIIPAYKPPGHFASSPLLGANPIERDVLLFFRVRLGGVRSTMRRFQEDHEERSQVGQVQVYLLHAALESLGRFSWSGDAHRAMWAGRGCPTTQGASGRCWIRPLRRRCGQGGMLASCMFTTAAHGQRCGRCCFMPAAHQLHHMRTTHAGLAAEVQGVHRHEP